MIVRLDTQRLQTLDQIREFLADSRPLDLQPQTRAEAYAFVAETLERFDYGQGARASPPIRRPLASAVTRLLRHRRPPRPPAPLPPPLHQGRHRAARRSRRPPRRSRHPPAAATGPCTCATASSTSPPSPTDIGHSTSYPPPRDDARDDPPRAHRHRRAADNPATCGSIPTKEDLDGIKGLYHLNLVDEVTQFQFVVTRAHRDALPRPRPRSPAPGASADSTPTTVPARCRPRRPSTSITKSRPRRSNHNGRRGVQERLAAILKHLGYPQPVCRVNAFTQQVLSPYSELPPPLSLPRRSRSTPRAASKRYPHANVMEKRRCPNGRVKPGTSFESSTRRQAERRRHGPQPGPRPVRRAASTATGGVDPPVSPAAAAPTDGGGGASAGWARVSRLRAPVAGKR